MIAEPIGLAAVVLGRGKPPTYAATADTPSKSKV